MLNALVLSRFLSRGFSRPPTLFAHMFFFEHTRARSENLRASQIANQELRILPVNNGQASYLLLQHACSGLVERLVGKRRDGRCGASLQHGLLSLCIEFDGAKHIAATDEAYQFIFVIDDWQCLSLCELGVMCPDAVCQLSDGH